MKFGGKIILSMMLGLVLALWGPVLAVGRMALDLSPAWACGLGQPQTMMANGAPAVTTPNLPTSPPNQPIGLFPAQYAVNQPITFTEDLSRLPTPIDPNTYQWQWDFGDGQTGNGFHVSHTYAQPGSYAVRVQLIDPADSTLSDPGFDSAYITIIPQAFANPPVAHIAASTEYVQVGSTLSYSAAGSRAQVGSALTYTWDFNDTSPEAHGEQVTHQFTLPGKAFVALRVQDARGAVSVATVPVVVALELPRAVLTASAVSAQPGTTLTFDAARSTPTSQPGDAIVSYHWAFGDGATATTTTPTIRHLFRKAGTYIVQVQAIDKAGLPGTAAVTILIGAGNTGGMGHNMPVILFGGGLILLVLLLGSAAAVIRERREAVRQQALAAARRARRTGTADRNVRPTLNETHSTDS